ncbi:MAG: aminotransferase class V-fold PLP-dependent enzyme, partial [Oscillospiraceae bacterium]
EIMLHSLEEKEIYVSSGSACSKGKTSGVLAQFGVSDKDADCAIRVSFSSETTAEDIDVLCENIRKGIERFRR